MSRASLSSFIKITVLFQQLQVFIFFCLAELFQFFNRSLLYFVKSTIKTVFYETNFSIYLIDVLLEIIFKVELSLKEKCSVFL